MAASYWTQIESYYLVYRVMVLTLQKAIPANVKATIKNRGKSPKNRCRLIAKTGLSIPYTKCANSLSVRSNENSITV